MHYVCRKGLDGGSTRGLKAGASKTGRIGKFLFGFNFERKFVFRWYNKKIHAWNDNPVVDRRILDAEKRKRRRSRRYTDPNLPMETSTERESQRWR